MSAITSSRAMSSILRAAASTAMFAPEISVTTRSAPVRAARDLPLFLRMLCSPNPAGNKTGGRAFTTPSLPNPRVPGEGAVKRIV
jgi:hypothetical protein